MSETLVIVFEYEMPKVSPVDIDRAVRDLRDIIMPTPISTHVAIKESAARVLDVFTGEGVAE